MSGRIYIPEPAGMIEAGLTEDRELQLRYPGDRPPPPNAGNRWGSVALLGGSGVAGAASSVTVIDTETIAVPTPLYVSLRFSADQSVWSPVPDPPAVVPSWITVRASIALDPNYGTRVEAYTIGPATGANPSRPGWARTSLVLACRLSVTLEISPDLLSSSYATWVAGICAPLTERGGASLASERTASNIYGFPLTESNAAQALANAGAGTLLLEQRAWRQQFWLRNLPAAEQPSGVVPQTVFVGFGIPPVFDAGVGIWRDYAIALDPGQIYESFPIETGSHWGNVYVATPVEPEDPTEAPWVVGTQSVPFTAPI